MANLSYLEKVRMKVLHVRSRVLDPLSEQEEADWNLKNVGKININEWTVQDCEKALRKLYAIRRAQIRKQLKEQPEKEPQEQPALGV